MHFSISLIFRRIFSITVGLFLVEKRSFRTVADWSGSEIKFLSYLFPIYVRRTCEIRYLYKRQTYWTEVNIPTPPGLGRKRYSVFQVWNPIVSVDTERRYCRQYTICWRITGVIFVVSENFKSLVRCFNNLNCVNKYQIKIKIDVSNNETYRFIHSLSINMVGYIQDIYPDINKRNSIKNISIFYFKASKHK